MLTVAEHPPTLLRHRLADEGLPLRIGPLVMRIRSGIAAVTDGIALHYAHHPVLDDGFADFHVSVERPRTLRRWVNRQVLFRFDGQASFAPLPGDQGFPLLEWGLNWCVYAHCHQYLSFHAAVVERDGRALILPGPPGSGKSTLCAGLAFGGWRLLSDELTLIDPATAEVVPMPRPISLKNASIDVIRGHAPQAVLGPVVSETTKGSVAHVQPPADSVRRAHERAVAGWVVLPRHVKDGAARLERLSKAAAFVKLVDQSFNYHVHGRRGFSVLADLIDRCDCYEFSYSRLDDAVSLFAALQGGSTG